MFFVFLLKKRLKIFFHIFLFSQFIFFLNIFFTDSSFSEAPSYSIVKKIEYKYIEKGRVKVEISLSKPAKIKYDSLKKPYLVYIDFFNSKLDRSVKRNIKIKDSPIKKIRAALNQETRTRVVIEMVKNTKFNVKNIEGSTKIEVYVSIKDKKPPKQDISIKIKKSSITNEKIEKIINNAKKAMGEKNYGKSIQLYTKVLSYPNHKFLEEAQMSLAFAREMKGQLAHARAEYKEFLRLYPKGKLADTIRGRLANLDNIKLIKKSNPVQTPTIKKSTTKDRLKNTMEEAHKMMTGGNYRQATRLYTKVLRYPDHEYRQEAQELLGLAREKTNQFAHAKAEYKEYLRLYPKGEGADRVKQRLAGIETAKAEPRKKLRKAKKRAGYSRFYGTLSQYYNRDDSYYIPDINAKDQDRITTNISLLSSNLNLTYRKRSEKYDLQSVLVGGYDENFLRRKKREGETRGEKRSVALLSRLYVDYLNNKNLMSIRFGRQQSSSGGVVGRFDGANLGLRLNKYIKSNLVLGLPVDTTKLKTYRTGKYFYGLNFDIGPFLESWDYNLFIINQMVDGITDRRAVGGEVHYLFNRQLFFGYLDYDIYFKEINTILFSGNISLPKKNNINFSIDFRKSPMLTTSNATIGQGVDSPGDLLPKMTNDNIKTLAKDRTTLSKSFFIGTTHPITKHMQISGDVTLTELGETKGSGGVEGMESTGFEYYYNLQLITDSLLIENDIAILGLRYSDASTSNTFSLVTNTRYPYTRNFRINPRLRIDYRERKKEDRFKLRPSLRLDYRWRKKIWFELDSGLEWDKNLTEQSDSTISYFISAGYRLDF